MLKSQEKDIKFYERFISLVKGAPDHTMRQEKVAYLYNEAIKHVNPEQIAAAYFEYIPEFVKSRLNPATQKIMHIEKLL